MSASVADRSGVAQFEAATDRFISPIAARFGLQSYKVDERLHAFYSPEISVSVYFPRCHGYDVTVCLAERFVAAWNPPDEFGISWFLRFLGIAATLPERTGEISQVATSVECYSRLIDLVLPRFLPHQSEQWKELYSFVTPRNT